MQMSRKPTKQEEYRAFVADAKSTIHEASPMYVRRAINALETFVDVDAQRYANGHISKGDVKYAVELFTRHNDQNLPYSVRDFALAMPASMRPSIERAAHSKNSNKGVVGKILRYGTAAGAAIIALSLLKDCSGNKYAQSNVTPTATPCPSLSVLYEGKPVTNLFAKAVGNGDIVISPNSLENKVEIQHINKPVPSSQGSSPKQAPTKDKTPVVVQYYFDAQTQTWNRVVKDLIDVPNGGQ
jgi:hypothetical protein